VERQTDRQTDRQIKLSLRLSFTTVRYFFISFYSETEQVAQLSQRDRAAGCVSFGQNICGSALAISVIAEQGCTHYHTGAFINALVLSNLYQYHHKSYVAKS